MLRAPAVMAFLFLAASVASAALPGVAAHGLSVEPLLADHPASVDASIPEAAGILAPGPVWRPLMDAPEGYALTFTCPATDAGFEPSTNAQTITTTCPFRVIDDQDLLGSPRIAVRPGGTSEVAFFSLHGQAEPGGPTPRSRDPVDTGSHTTFTTADQGISWTDNPINSHFPAGGALGEAAAGVMDRDGHLYIGYLWSHPAAAGAWTNTIGLYKQDTVEQPVRYVSGHHIPADKGYTIDDVAVAYIPGRFVEPELANGTEDGADDRSAADDNDTIEPERILASWFQRASNTTGFIDAAWTDSSSRGGWTRLNATQRIGPCSAGSNAVGFDSGAYVACVVAKGYEGRDRARVGEVDIWRIDLDDNTAKLVKSTPFRGGHPLLAVDDRGRMGYASYEYLDQNRIRAEVGFGWYGREWTLAGDIGPALHGLSGGSPAIDARVTGIAISRDTGSLFLTYQEQATAPTVTPGFDPSNPLPNVAVAEYRKMLATIGPCDGFLAAFDLQVGQSSIHFPGAEIGGGTAFDDLGDGIVMTRDAITGRELALLAIGDYGVVQYAGIYEEVPPTCPTIAPPLFPGVPAIPQALTITSPATTAISAAFGVVSVAMVAYLLTVKRRAAVAATAEDR